MLYLQLKARATAKPGEQLLVRHIADALDSDGAKVMDLPVECVTKEGVWRLPAMAVVKAVMPVCPEVQVLGAAECFVHILPENKRNRTRPLRTAFAFLVLLVGSLPKLVVAVPALVLLILLIRYLVVRRKRK